MPVAREEGSWKGILRDRMEFVGDIVSPAADPEEWEALRRLEAIRTLW